MLWGFRVGYFSPTETKDYKETNLLYILLILYGEGADDSKVSLMLQVFNNNIKVIDVNERRVVEQI